MFRKKEAADVASSCMSMNPSSADAVYKLGLCFYYKGELDEGVELFMRALTLDANHNEAKNMGLKAETLRAEKQRGNYRITYNIRFYISFSFSHPYFSTDFYFRSRKRLFSKWQIR